MSRGINAVAQWSRFFCYSRQKLAFLLPVHIWIKLKNHPKAKQKSPPKYAKGPTVSIQNIN
jgi:hypothetical protein